jgi:AcrR family transcriptional regulator
VLLGGTLTRYNNWAMIPAPKNPVKPNLRERKKAAVRSRVIEVAQQRFHEKGFEATTIEEICEASMTSKRTFFRYFQDKESLVFPNRELRLNHFKIFLSSHLQAENPFDILRFATRVFGKEYDKNKDKILSQERLIRSSESLLAREREIDQDWGKAIADAFAKRTGKLADNDLWAQVLAGAIMGVIRSTMNYWVEHDCEGDLIHLGLYAIDCLESGFPKP